LLNLFALLFQGVKVDSLGQLLFVVIAKLDFPGPFRLQLTV
jgi:hypothetical protein